jgi:alkanesulfonate monooxygenase SsuD/methylene tetrahydromethanopterin reductase-like flavin-dependent oxidoreductase (luciferase family)
LSGCGERRTAVDAGRRVPWRIFVRFGVGFLRGSAPAGQSAGVWFDTLLRLVCRADEMGYEYVQVAEPRSPFDGRYEPDPVPLLSAVAALTVGIRIVAPAIVPSRAQAPTLAGRLAVLDNLSHGRLDVSFYRADPRSRRWPSNNSPQANGARFADGLDICRRLWSGQDVDQTGQEPGPATRRSYQSPHPPIFVASATSASACADAGLAGYHLQVRPATSPAELGEMLAAYRAGRATAGREPGRVRLDYTCYLAKDDRVARTVARLREEAAHRYDFDRAHAADVVLAGSPARIGDQVAAIADAFGDDLSLRITLIPVPGVDTEQALELFADRVMGS